MRKITVFILILITNSLAHAQTAGNSQPPNILVILGCQHSGWAMSCSGADYFETPHLDRLSDDGVLFTNAYTTHPVCMPARASLMTGHMPSEMGLNYNGAVDSVSADPALGELLKNAGYNTGWIGKSHLPPGADEGLDTFLTFNYDDNRAISESISFIQKDRESPFFLLTNVTRTHDICQYARKLGDFSEGTSLPQGELDNPPSDEHLPSLPDNFGIPENEPSALREIVVPAHPPAYPLANAEERDWRELRWAYGELTGQMDESIGNLLQFLHKQDLYDDMLIIYLAEHGDGSGEHQWNQKQVLYESAANVPFIIKPPKSRGVTGRIDSSNVVSAILDLMPTIADYANITVPEDRHGLSVRPLIEDPNNAKGHEFVVTETTFGSFAQGDHGVSGRMVRTPQYKYIVYDKGDNREQLFDMVEDPGEMVDLSVSSEHENVLMEHRQYLMEWTHKTGDFFDSIPSIKVNK